MRFAWQRLCKKDYTILRTITVSITGLNNLSGHPSMNAETHFLARRFAELEHWLINETDTMLAVEYVLALADQSSFLTRAAESSGQGSRSSLDCRHKQNFRVMQNIGKLSLWNKRFCHVPLMDWTFTAVGCRAWVSPTCPSGNSRAGQLKFLKLTTG